MKSGISELQSDEVVDAVWQHHILIDRSRDDASKMHSKFVAREKIIDTLFRPQVELTDGRLDVAGLRVLESVFAIPKY